MYEKDAPVYSLLLVSQLGLQPITNMATVM